MKYSLLLCSLISFSLSAKPQTESATYYEGTILRQPITITKKTDGDTVTYTQEFKHSEIHLAGYTFPLPFRCTSKRPGDHWAAPQTIRIECTKDKTSGTITGAHQYHLPEIPLSRISQPITEETYCRLKALYILKSQKSSTWQH